MVKELVKSIFNEVYKCLGYIENNNGIYLFYNIDEGISKIKGGIQLMIYGGY